MGNKNKNKKKKSCVKKEFFSLKTRLFILAGLLLFAGVFFSLSIFVNGFRILPVSAQSQKQSDQKAVVSVEPEKFFRRFDGLEVADASAASLWPVGVMIENLMTVRPQAGLSDASLIYETLAEGGATRFLVLFTGGSTAPVIGPVRSARPYYLDWAYEYAALYAHAGGSPQALGNIRDYDTNNLDALSRDAVYFWRDTSRGAPHNLFTSGEKLVYALRDKGLLEKESTTRMWLFKDDAPLMERGEDQKFYKVKFSSYTYEVEWKFIKEENLYLRYNADRIQVDANNQQELKAKNIIVQIVPPEEYLGEKGRIGLNTHGEGKAFVLRDGIVIEGIWKKAERTDRTLFYDANGAEIEFNRGQTWIEVIPEGREWEW
ncbi:MAG: DUF3048 domain-containing protein [Patescibacteria group bacterium]